MTARHFANETISLLAPNPREMGQDLAIWGIWVGTARAILNVSGQFTKRIQ